MERTTNERGRVARAAAAVVLAAGLMVGGIWGPGAATAQGSGGTPGSSPAPMVAHADPAGQPASTEKAIVQPEARSTTWSPASEPATR